MIACVLFPHFAAMVARHHDPELGEKPLIIGGYPWQRKKVYAASPEARRAGVEPGMSLSKAWLLRPDAHFLPAEESHYQAAFEQIIVRLSDFSHRIEPDTAIQTTPACYLDLGSLRESDVQSLAVQMLDELTPFTPSLGIASNKFTARAAATLTESGQITRVALGDEAHYLAEIPLSRLRVSRDLARRFYLLGIRSLGDLASLPGHAIPTQFGTEGIRLYELSHGRDDRPLSPRLPDASYLAERNFDPAIDNLLILDKSLRDIAEELADFLAQEDRVCHELTLKILLEDRSLREVSLALRMPLARRESIFRQLTALRERLTLESGVLSALVLMGDITAAVPVQLPLFPEMGASELRLEDIALRLRARHKALAIFWPELTGDVVLLPERRYQLVDAA
jgi:DNA polymerase-4